MLNKNLYNKCCFFKVKCDVYWPQEGTEMYGIIEVTLINMISLAYYVKRIFAIRCKVNGKVHLNCYISVV